MPQPPARYPTLREAMTSRREEMLARLNKIKDAYLEPILARFPNMLPTKPDSAARYALYAAMVWFAIWMLMAAVVALKQVFPGFLDQFAFMSYGRLRQAESNVLNWGVLFTGAVGAAFAIVPRVCGVRLWSERIGAQLVMLHVQVVLAGTVLVMLGRTQGVDGLEWPWPVDFALMMVMGGVLQVLMTTVLRRKERVLNAPARHLLAAFHVLPITYAVANFATPYVFGVKQTFWSGIGAAGFTLAMTLVGVGSTLFVLPRATGNPIWSQPLAAAGFWLLVFTGPWLGLAQRVLGPAPDWTETLGIAFAIVAVVPAAFVTVNVLATIRRSSGRDPAVAFMAGATVIWALATLQQLTGALRHPAGIVGATWWNEGMRTAFAGAFGLWLVGLTYHLIPRIRGRALRNPGLVSAHFWIGATGVAVAWASLAVAGIVQGYLQNAGPAFATGEGWRVVSGAVKPMLIARLAAGGFVLAGVGLLLYNVQRTVAAGAETEPEPVVAHSAAASVGGAA